MSNIDIKIIQKHLHELENSLTYLKSKGDITERDIIEDVEQRFAVERALHLAIQNVIDVGSHVLASLNVNNIETYADIPEKLADANIIGEKLSKNLVNMAKFRNILVHEYVKIESKKLVSFVKNNLSDFENFTKAIVKFIGKSFC